MSKKIRKSQKEKILCMFFVLFILDINECLKRPCKNGATCLDNIDGYICKCAAGYTGENCDLGK